MMFKCSKSEAHHLSCPENPKNSVTAFKEEFFQANSFCENLSKEVRIHLNYNPLLDCQLTISQKIQDIHNILTEKSVLESKMDENTQNRDINTERIDDKEIVTNFMCVPKCEWVYETPPRQRIMLPKLDECAIQPAVICTVKKQSNIYELNPNIQIDMNNFTNRQNIEVDGRYLKHLSTFENQMEIDFDLDCLEPRNQRTVQDEGSKINSSYRYFQRQEECSSAKYNFENPFLNIHEDHFMSVLSRPTKTVQKVPRTNNFSKRKLENREGTPVSSIQHQLDESFEKDFSSIEDNGNFKISTQCSVEENNNCKRKNLFQSYEGDNLFRFN